jgi:hypothetical protein
MAKRKSKSKSKSEEADSSYFLKIVVYFLLGSLWVRFSYGLDGFGLPIGLIVGILLAHHEHFQIDRKIEYALLLVAAVLSFFFPLGFILQL